MSCATVSDSLIILEEEQESVIKDVYKKAIEVAKRVFEEANELFELKDLEERSREIVGCANIPGGFMKLMETITQDYTTYEHSVNVAFFSAFIGTKIGLELEAIEKLTFAALLHDIGKIRIDNKILDKPSILQDSEFEAVKLHSEYSVDILTKNGIENQSVLQGVLCHHERLDGSGYPHGYKGKRVPKFARIIGMCDVFDALTTNRTFRKSYSSFEALLHIRKEMSSQFEIELIDALIALHR